MDCTSCGACCVAPDIAALDKPLGLRCSRLGDDCRCTAYAERPQVCRDYQPDALCELVAAPTLEARVERYLAHFGLAQEAEEIRRSGVTSLKRWRRERWRLT
jgi:Fe-S-cluster containining protein